MSLCDARSKDEERGVGMGTKVQFEGEEADRQENLLP